MGDDIVTWIKTKQLNKLFFSLGIIDAILV